MADPATSAPRASLSLTDVAIMTAGIVIGVGIFKAPQLVALFGTGNVAIGPLQLSGEAVFIWLWALGGLLTLIGAICYAELGSARPNAGGEYAFLREAYGHPLALLFAWGRCSVIQPGAIAAVAFVMGDYANVVVPLGAYGPSIHAIIAIAIFTGINYVGTTPGTWAQKIFEAMTMLGIIGVIIAAFVTMVPTPPPAAPRDVSWGGAGLAMVFILLTYGGWNEAAYLSGELQNARRNMARALIIGVVVVIVLYLLINFAYLRVLGLEGIRKSSAVGADMMRIVAGEPGAIVLSCVVVLSALTTLNGTIITGARSYYALGRDLHVLRHIGTWEARGETPGNALVLQGAVSVLLVIFGGLTRNGFENMVAYTAPVFWFFMLLVSISIYIFRSRETEAVTHYRVPLYPVTPAILALTCCWMLYSSLAYAGWGSIIGVIILFIGTPLLLLKRAAT
jgi:amino acid transporter